VGPRAWFNLGTLHQQRGETAQAVAAYRRAIELDHPELSPKAAVNLGYVLFNQAGMVEEAEAAFQIAIDSDNAEQARLARQNVAAMHQLTAERQQGEPTGSSRTHVTCRWAAAPRASSGAAGCAATTPEPPREKAAPGAPSCAWCSRPGHVHPGRAT
jgi:tetratricopeptide (TPR) repeat protein